MTIDVKLFATLREGRGKVVSLDYEQIPDLRTITQEMDITEDNIAILLVNGRDARLEDVPQDGDVISIFPPVGGG